MRAAVILCTFILGLALASPNFRLEFEKFKVEYGKKYTNKQEEMHRFSVFNDNLRLIHQHNEEFRQGKHTYTLGVNKYSDMTPEEFESSMNGLKTLPAASKSGRVFQYSKSDDLPNSVDWRDKGAVTPVKDQGQCGSCWAFSATGTLEGQHFLKSGKLVSLSEQNLVDCTDFHTYGEFACGGGYVETALQYIIDIGGIDTEDSYPYRAHEQKCSFDADDIGANATSYVSLPVGDEDALKNAVATIGPISIAFDASGLLFQSYKSGVFCRPGCSKKRLDHAVLAVGYGTEDDGTDYWMIKNSWGYSWGEDGYFKMCRNHDNECGVATDAVYPII